MKALSVWQPHAILLATGARIIETRSWPTNYRGEILIHAAKKMDEDRAFECADAVSMIRTRGFKPTPQGEALTRVPFANLLGVALAVATLEDCRPIPHPTGTEFDAKFGGFGEGRFGFFLSDLRPLQKPIPWKGAQGMWDVPAELEQRIWADFEDYTFLSAAKAHLAAVRR